MKTFLTPFLCGSLLLSSACLSLLGQQPGSPASARAAREDQLLVTVTATVEAIDLTNREVTLKGPLGNAVTFTVDEKVKRLKEFKVGDLVRADYYVSIAAEVRKPTPGEEQNPFVLLDVAGKTPATSSPAVAGARRFKVVSTIEGLDRPTRTVTVKGPRGNYFTARVADPALLTQMRIGENIVVTFTEAVAISLEKAEKKQSE